MSKMPLIIIEGADGAGKTSTAKLLCENEPFKLLNLPKRTYFSTSKSVPVKMVIDNATSLSLYLELLKFATMNSDFIWVLDRSILSNLAYTCENKELTRMAIQWMNNQFDVQLYLLDRDLVDEDFKDDLLESPKEDFNKTIRFYREYEGSGEKIFRTRLIYDGVFDSLKQMILIDTIMQSTS